MCLWNFYFQGDNGLPGMIGNCVRRFILNDSNISFGKRTLKNCFRTRDTTSE